jgi:hypothetical protein
MSLTAPSRHAYAGKVELSCPQLGAQQFARKK